MKKTILALLMFAGVIAAAPAAKGSPAPDFSLKDESGKSAVLSEYKGKKAVVLVFYPGDNTPVCTKQLCEIRDSWSDFTALDSVQVFGINNNDSESHLKFKMKNSYPFPLLLDEGWKTAQKYGVSDGKGVTRYVFVISKTGEIVYAQKGKPPVSEITAALKAAR